LADMVPDEMPDGFEHDDDDGQKSCIRLKMGRLKYLWRWAGMFRAVTETGQLERGRHWMDDID